MLKNFVLPELVHLANRIRVQKGPEYLENFEFNPQACGCMGPSKGEVYCFCKQQIMLERNLVEVVAEIDADLAKRIMLRRLVSALPG